MRTLATDVAVIGAGTAARTRIWLDLPSGGGDDALRGALMAMGLIPQPLPLPIDPTPRKQALATLADIALAFIDVFDPALRQAHGASRLGGSRNARSRSGGERRGAHGFDRLTQIERLAD